VAGLSAAFFAVLAVRLGGLLVLIASVPDISYW